jgi:hypothetical protein
MQIHFSGAQQQSQVNRKADAYFSCDQPREKINI